MGKKIFIGLIDSTDSKCIKILFQLKRIIVVQLKKYYLRPCISGEKYTILRISQYAYPHIEPFYAFLLLEV